MREHPYMKHLMIALGARPDMRIQRQNTGEVEVYRGGHCIGHFNAGPPPGTGDLCAIIAPYGTHMEIETKAATTETRDSQKARKRMLESMGAIYVEARRDDKLTLVQNVDRAVLLVEKAIEDWKVNLMSKTPW